MRATPQIIVAGNLQVAWRRVGDRLAHEIAVRHGDTVIPVLTSLEGAADDLWPPSPPLQEIRIEDRQERRQVGLLVGMAGQSHWSVSIEAHSQARGLQCDVACRVRTAPAWLGSSYAVMLPVQRRGLCVFCETPAGRCEIHGDTPLDLNTDSNGRGSELLIIRAPEGGDLPPTTVRWRYQVRLVG